MNMIKGQKMNNDGRTAHRSLAREVRKEGFTYPTVAQKVIASNWIIEALLMFYGVNTTTMIDNYVVRPFSENLVSQLKSTIVQVRENRFKCANPICDGYHPKDRLGCGKCGTTSILGSLVRSNVTGKYEQGIRMIVLRLVEKTKSAIAEGYSFSKYDTFSNWSVIQVKCRKGYHANNASQWGYAGVALVDANNALISLGLDNSEMLRLKGDSWRNKSGKKKTCFRPVVFALLDPSSPVEVAIDAAFISMLEAENIAYRNSPSAEYLHGLNKA